MKSRSGRNSAQGVQSCVNSRPIIVGLRPISPIPLAPITPTAPWHWKARLLNTRAMPPRLQCSQSSHTPRPEFQSTEHDGSVVEQDRHEKDNQTERSRLQRECITSVSNDHSEVTTSHFIRTAMGVPTPSPDPWRLFPRGVDWLPYEQRRIGPLARTKLLRTAIADFGDVEISFLVDTHSVGVEKTSRPVGQSAPRIQ